jgi:hypothetical protein
VVIPAIRRPVFRWGRIEPDFDLGGTRGGGGKLRQRDLASNDGTGEPVAGRQGRGFLPEDPSFAFPDPPVVRSFSRPYVVRTGFL